MCRCILTFVGGEETADNSTFWVARNSVETWISRCRPSTHLKQNEIWLNSSERNPANHNKWGKRKSRPVHSRGNSPDPRQFYRRLGNFFIFNPQESMSSLELSRINEKKNKRRSMEEIRRHDPTARRWLLLFSLRKKIQIPYKAMAFRRLIGTITKLWSNPELLHQYHDTRNYHLSLGIIEEVGESGATNGTRVHITLHAMQQLHLTRRHRSCEWCSSTAKGPVLWTTYYTWVPLCCPHWTTFSCASE